MVDVPQLQSSIINREIAEQKHRPVPLLYRRFTDQFEQPTDTTLLQAMLLALTNHKEDIPNVVKATDNSNFSANIKALNPANAGQATTGQEHRHNQVKNGVTVGEDTPVSGTVPDAQGDVAESAVSTQKVGNITAHASDGFAEQAKASVTSGVKLYNGHLDNSGAIKNATENKLANDDIAKQMGHPDKLQQMADNIDLNTEKRNAQIKNLLSVEGWGNKTEIDELTAINARAQKAKKNIQSIFKAHNKEMKETTVYKNDDGLPKGKVEKKKKSKYQKEGVTQIYQRGGKKVRLSDYRAQAGGMR
jgi:hypothetical protein